MKLLTVITATFFSLISYCQNNTIPYGSKTFTIADYYDVTYNTTTKKNEQRLLKSVNTSLTLEISKNTVNKAGDFFVVSGAFVSGQSAEYIVEWSCDNQPTQKVYKITTNDSREMNSWVLSVGNNGSFQKLAMIMGKGTSYLIVFR